MRILVTGGTGFIGSHLCAELLNQGNYVFCLDNLSTSSLKNVQSIAGNPNFEFIEHDIINPIDIRVDQIYNLACPASPVHYQSDPIKTTKTSVLGIMNLLELANKYNSTILQCSTSEVYGNPLVHPQKETYWGNVNTVGIRSCYDEGKRCAETIINDYRRICGINGKIVRIFNTYGPNMAENDGRVVSNFIIQALKNEDLTVYGDGSQTRSFCYVSDLVKGIIKMMNTEGFYGPVNLGNPSERTVKNLADLIIGMTNSKSKIVYMPLPSDDPVKRKPDISLAKEKLDWQPVVNIEQGLEKTIDYFKTLV